jgi:thiol-disulfide isomerase/thioredoxin
LRHRKGVFGAGAIGVVCLAVVAALAATTPSGAVRPAPPLPSQALVGGPVALPALRGRPALVSFFASWCAPCRTEAPQLLRAEALMRGRARVVAIDWSDDTGSARTFVRRAGWRFPVLVDRSGVAADRWRLAGLPTTYVLDPRGRIVRRLVGPQTSAVLVRAAQRVL